MGTSPLKINESSLIINAILLLPISQSEIFILIRFKRAEFTKSIRTSGSEKFSVGNVLTLGISTLLPLFATF